MKRRNFIKNTAAGIALPSAFQGLTTKAFGLNAMSQLLNPVTQTDKVLVIVRLSGGNDGLNTVIPLDQYAELNINRGNIAIPQAQVLKLNGNTLTGLNPALTGVQALYNEGKVKIIQSVSYPNQSYSHFRATDIFMSASDSDQVLTSGWAGRYLSNEYPNYPLGFPNTTMPDPLGIQLNEMTLTFEGLSTLMGIAVSDPTNPYAFLTDTGTTTVTGKAGTELNYLRTIAIQSDKYGKVVRDAYNKSVNTGTYPNTSLAGQLAKIARMIKGGLKTRVYIVQMGSFDTHAQQVDPTNHAIGNQSNLLAQLSDGLLAFQRDLEKQGIADRVLTMTFSEFGRRIKSNASGGTDHGAAYPMFIMGTKIKGGVLGNNVTLPKVADDNANIPMQYDFRSVYGTILRDWFCTSDTDVQKVLLKSFQYLPILAAGVCAPSGAFIEPLQLATGASENKIAGIKLVSAYPNPFDFGTTINFTTEGGYTLVQIMDTEGQVIAIPVDGNYNAGEYRVFFNGGYLPAGLYYMRFQNGEFQQVKSLVKVQ